MSGETVIELPESLTLKNERNLLVLANTLTQQQQIQQETAVQIIEAAYVRAAEAKYGAEYEFWARIKNDGSIQLAQVLKVVEIMRNECREVTLSDLQDSQSHAELGQYVVNPLEPVHPPQIAEWLGSGETEIQNVKITVA